MFELLAQENYKNHQKLSKSIYDETSNWQNANKRLHQYVRIIINCSYTFVQKNQHGIQKEKELAALLPSQRVSMLSMHVL